jgi:hypothetical protein
LPASASEEKVKRPNTASWKKNVPTTSPTRQLAIHQCSYSPS